MDKYFNLYREMISLRGLSDHTLNSYCTYIRTYLNYLDTFLQKLPEDVTWCVTEHCHSRYFCGSIFLDNQHDVHFVNFCSHSVNVLRHQKK